MRALTQKARQDHPTNLLDFGIVRGIQCQLKAQGVKLDAEADATSSGPAYIMLTDPDGNPILIDQHV